MRLRACVLLNVCVESEQFHAASAAVLFLRINVWVTLLFLQLHNIEGVDFCSSCLVVFENVYMRHMQA